MKKQFLILALVCQLALSGFALQPESQKRKPTPQSEQQQPARPGDDDVVKITTNLVQVDPVITGRNGRIVTELAPFKAFFKAEDYHQEYFRLHGKQSYCRVVIAPKVAKFREHFKDKLKAN